MVLPTSCIKNHCLNKHLLNGTNHAKDSKLPEVMAKLSMLPFLPLQKSMHGSLGTKQHGYHAISIFSNFLCPCIQSWFDMFSRLPSMLYVLNTTPCLPGSHTSKVILPCRLHLLAFSDGLLVVPFHCLLLLPVGAQL